MLRRSHLTDELAALQHNYELEPPDDIIAELQSTVVEARQRGERTRLELLEDLAAAARALGANADAKLAVDVAALAILLRMEAG
jgi:hypothetical protein